MRDAEVPEIEIVQLGKSMKSLVIPTYIYIYYTIYIYYILYIYIYINLKYLKVGTKDYERFESQRG